MNAPVRALTFLTLAILLVAATLRTSGLDFEVYLAEFLDPVDSLSSREVGYVALIVLVGQFAGFWLVLLIGNFAFLATHLVALRRTRTVAQSLAFLFYLAYIGLFLIYGSPRRLIAYSIVTALLLAVAFRPQGLRDRPTTWLAATVVAATFHASALVTIPVLVAYAYGAAFFRRARNLMLLAVAGTVAAFMLYAAGAVDYLTTKIVYYAVDAAAEQAYLEDVPSVGSGLLKRSLAIALIWFGTHKLSAARQPALTFCLIEAVLYGGFGSVSPVLAVTASYFAIGYLIPILATSPRPGFVTPRSLILLSPAMVYYLPTSIGLIKMFWEFYAP